MNGRGMRALLAGVIAMGVLIVVGTAALVVLVVMRLSTAGTSTRAMLDEPAGTHVAGMTAVGGRLALHLDGGGGDRIVLVDPATGRVVSRLAISR